MDPFATFLPRPSVPKQPQTQSNSGRTLPTRRASGTFHWNVELGHTTTPFECANKLDLEPKHELEPELEFELEFELELDVELQLELGPETDPRSRTRLEPEFEA